MTISSKNGRMDSRAASANSASFLSNTIAVRPGFLVELLKSFSVNEGCSTTSTNGRLGTGRFYHREELSAISAACVRG